MRTHARAVVALVLVLATVVAAAPHKILVLPLDGDADPALRTKLDQTMHKLAKSLEGQVTMGNTTFSETAAAVGCDPGAPACANSVMSTLAVDEIVYGTATTVNGQTTIVIRRATKNGQPRELQTTIGAQEPPDKAEQGLAPVFHPPTKEPASAGSGSAAPIAAGSGSAAPVAAGSGSAAPNLEGSGSATPPAEGSAAPPPPPAPPVDEHDRNLGLGLTIGGGLAFVVGIALWASEQSVQSDIDNHPTRTIGDINDLKSLEDRAGNYAFFGNVMVVAGLAVGGVGAYYLYKYHKQSSTTIAPAPAEHGAGMTLVIGGRW